MDCLYCKSRNSLVVYVTGQVIKYELLGVEKLDDGRVRSVMNTDNPRVLDTGSHREVCCSVCMTSCTRDDLLLLAERHAEKKGGPDGLQT